MAVRRLRLQVDVERQAVPAALRLRPRGGRRDHHGSETGSGKITCSYYIIYICLFVFIYLFVCLFTGLCLYLI